MVKSKKIKAFSYINHGLFHVIKCLYFFDVTTHSLGARAEICQIFSVVILFWNYLTFSKIRRKAFFKRPSLIMCPRDFQAFRQYWVQWRLHKKEIHVLQQNSEHKYSRQRINIIEKVAFVWTQDYCFCK